MPIGRISVFFTTHLETNQPSICNTLTNIAFAPLQHLIGKKNYQCLNGRVYELASVPQPSSSQLSSAWKVIVVIAAIISTPCGILTRYLSFRSSDITLGYWIALLLSLDVVQYPRFLVGVDLKLQIKIQAQLNALEKQKALDRHITSAIELLQELERKIYCDPLKVKEWLVAALAKTDFPYPFQFAEKLKNDLPRDIPNRDLLQKFEDLHWNCLRHLPFKLSTIEAAKQQQICNELCTFLNKNNLFFAELSAKLQDLDLPTDDVVSHLNEQKESLDYLYPFYTQPLVLMALKQIIPSKNLTGVSETQGISPEIPYEDVPGFLPQFPEKNAPFVETPPEATSSEFLTPQKLTACEATYTNCIQIMNQNNPLNPLIEETPRADYPMIAQFKLAMNQLDNICQIEALYKFLRNKTT